MKKISILFLGVFILLLNACQDDFKLADDWKDIPVVYGLLSLNDTSHYIRIERAFINPDASAVEVAQIPDSLYYSNILVQLKDVATGQFYTLQRVDGNLEGYPRQEGVFATSPNYLYKIRDADINLKGGKEYQLIVKRADETILTTASTKVIDTYEFSDSYPPAIINWNSSKVRFEWRSNEKAAAFYDLKLILHYDELDPGTNQMVPKTLEWVLVDRIDRTVTNDVPSPRTGHDQTGSDFFKFIGSRLEGNNYPKVFKSIDAVVQAGGSELLKYISVGQVNTGITGTQSIPVYSNLSNGYGILSSKYQLKYEGITVKQETKDSLRLGQYTKTLNWQ